MPQASRASKNLIYKRLGKMKYVNPGGHMMSKKEMKKMMKKKMM